MDKRRPLTSDELGAKGESRFPELCLDARLKPAKPDRDRTGWDFIVTWPLAAGILDTRPAPLVAQVQLKTIWADNDTVSLNLGTLYNIVSDTRPAFVVVLAVDDPTLAFARLHLLHITGDFLAEILRRLRKAQSDGKEAGDVQFRARVSKWGAALVSVCGTALRTAIEAAVPDGMAAYGTGKQTLLQTLGYEKGRLRLTTTIEANSHDDIVEGFLGVRPLRLVEAERFDTRFDIPVSLGKWDTTAATIALKPMRFDRGVVTIERTRDGQLLQFHGDIFTAPSAVAGPHRVVLEFRNALIRIRVDLRGAGAGTTAAINLITADDPDSIAATAAAWRDFFTLLAWMASEPLSFELRTAKKKISPIIGSAEPRLNPEQARRMDYYARSADIVDWVMARAEAPGARMRPAAMIEAADDLDVIKAIEQTPDEVSALGFTTPYVDTLPEVFEYDMLYLNRIAIDNFEIAYAARTKMKSQRTGESMAWTSGPLQLVYVRKIKPNADAFGHFAGKARRTSGIVNWVAPAEAQFGVLLPSPAIDVPARRISGEARGDAPS